MNSNAETLELYRMMVATVTENEQRRQQISSVFIILLAAGFGAAGAIENFNMLFATSAALVVSFVWFMQVRFLKQLASAKFHVIGQLEEKLPFQPFAKEWKFLKRDNSSQRWGRLNLSGIEMALLHHSGVGGSSPYPKVLYVDLHGSDLGFILVAKRG